ncbi:MAG: ArnT family glycosyltransferase [Planctomycetota bacterium]|jgi:hypothetical protein
MSYCSQIAPSGALNSLPNRRAALTLLGALIACALLRVWVAGHSGMIARDGTLYVEMAQRWSDPSRGPGWVVEHYVFEVGYPAAMAATHRIVTWLGGADDLAGWEQSGRIVSLVGSLASVAGVWLIAGLVFNWRVAWITALLLGVGRKWTGMGADVLKDPLAIALQVWAVGMALLALRRMLVRSRGALLWAALSGVMVGCGYLVHRSSLLVAPLVALLWAAGVIWQRKRSEGRTWLLALGCLAVMVGAMAVVAGPYVIAIGGLTKRMELPPQQVSATMAGGMLATVYTLKHGAIAEVLKKLSEVMHPVLAVGGIIWLVTWAVDRLKVRLPESVNIQLRWPGAVAMIGWAALFVPVMAYHGEKWQNVSFRYVALLAALLAPLGGAGVNVLGEWLAHIAVHKRRRLGDALVAVVALGLATAMCRHAARPLHIDKDHFRRAGEYVRHIASSGDVVLCGSSWTRHYSQLERHDSELTGKELLPRSRSTWVDPKEVVDIAKEIGADYLTLSERYVFGHNDGTPANPHLQALLDSKGFERLKSFPQDKEHSPDVVRIYRIVSEKLPANVESIPQPPPAEGSQ